MYLRDENTAEPRKNSLINEQQIQHSVGTSKDTLPVIDVGDSMSENTIKRLDMSENTVKENFHQYGFYPTIESDPGSFHKDAFICPTDARVIQWKENRKIPTQTATKLPKIIVVRPIKDPS